LAESFLQQLEVPIILQDAVDTKLSTVKQQPSIATRIVIVAGQVDIVHVGHKEIQTKYDSFADIKKIPIRYRKSLFYELTQSFDLPEATIQDEADIVTAYNEAIRILLERRQQTITDDVKLLITNYLPETVYLLAAPLNNKGHLYVFGYTVLPERVLRELDQLIAEIPQNNNTITDSLRIFTEETLNNMLINRLDNLDGSKDDQKIVVKLDTLKTIPMVTVAEIRDLPQFYNAFELNECSTTHIKTMVTSVNKESLIAAIPPLPIHRLVKSNLQTKEATEYELLCLVNKRIKNELLQRHIRHQPAETMKLTTPNINVLHRLHALSNEMMQLLANVPNGEELPIEEPEVIINDGMNGLVNNFTNINQGIAKQLSDLSSQLQSITKKTTPKRKRSEHVTSNNSKKSKQ
jgi:hypothetical protein